MGKKLKVYCVGSNHDFLWLKDDNFIRSGYNEADIVIFPGGSDWSPSFYGQKEGSRTYSHDLIDTYQAHKALRCINDKKFMIGICRGAQMLCVLAGGNLIQDVSNHAGRNHSMHTYDGKILMTNSLHHQMMDVLSIPDQASYQMLAWSDPISTRYLNGHDEEICFYGTDIPYIGTMEIEPEIVYYSNIGGFGVQGHPEMYMESDTSKFIIENVNLYYEKFQNEKDNIIMPEFIKVRLSNINGQIKNNAHTHSTKKNRNSSVEIARKW